MKTMQDDSKNVKTISMMTNNLEREIIPVKIILDTDKEIRATNFHGTTRTGKSYSVPQLVFMRAIGKQRSVDVSFSFHQIDEIMTALKKIKEENIQYFDDL